MKPFAGGLVVDKDGKPTAAALRDKLISMGYPENITLKRVLFLQQSLL